MGSCISSLNASSITGTSAEKKAQQKNVQIDAILAESAGKKPVKLLLLGTGESGKTTIFKQLQLMHGKKFDKQEAMESIPIIFKNVMENFLVLLAQLDYEIGTRLQGVDMELIDLKDDFTAKYDMDSPVTIECAAKIKEIWNKPAIQQLWRMRSEFQIMDALGYYVEQLDRIAAIGYIPNQLDILSARVRSSGIIEHHFDLNDQKFTVIDVGGQRNERKKWIHCFDGVTGIIFVVAISEYDQVLFEDKHVSRVSEALKVFAALLNNSLFFSTPIILILNKNDVFEKKILQKPFSKIDGVDEEFMGPYANDPGVSDKQAIDAAKDYMKNLFLKCNTNPDRKIYTYFTTALENKSISQFFDAAKDLLAKAAQ